MVKIIIGGKKGKKTYAYKKQKKVPVYRNLKLRPKMYGTHFFKRTYLIEDFTYAASGGKCYSVRLNDVPTVTEITNLFDQYKINKWIVKVYYAGYDNDISNGAVTSNNNVGMVGSAIDYTDINTPTNAYDLKDYDTYQEKQILQCHPFTRVVRLRCNEMVYRSTTTTGYQVSTKSTWLTTDTPDIPHFGIKFFFDTPPNTTMKVKVEGVVYFSCKSVK